MIERLRLLVIGIALVGACSVVQPRVPEEVASDPLFAREVLEYEMSDDVVKYQYKGEQLPETLAEGENVALRTENSYAREVGRTDEAITYEARIYAAPTFIEDEGEWYVRETATTTSLAWDAFNRRSPLATLLIPEVHADDFFSAAGDGRIQYDTSSDWDTTHDATASVGGISYDTSTIIVKTDFPGNYEIMRLFVPFNTSAIPVAATISAVTLNMYTLFTSNGDNDGLDYITVVQTSQGTHTVLATADYDQCGAVDSPVEGVDAGQRKDISSITGSTYLSFTLNSTGRGWVKKSGQSSNCSATTGYTCLGLREGHDVADTAPDGSNYSAFSASEDTGTSQDPYLSVTYSLPSPARPFRLFGGATWHLFQGSFFLGPNQ